MLKRDELSIPESCFNRAADDERIFVLLERDIAAPHSIREWALERVARGKNHADDPQIVEALKCAELMEAKQDCEESVGNCFSQNKAIRSTFPVPANDAEKLLQRDTINVLADCLVREAARLERTNGLVRVEDLKREAQALRDYAENLAPRSAAEEATR
jgi:hypothetical protein